MDVRWWYVHDEKSQRCVTREDYKRYGARACLSDAMAKNGEKNLRENSRVCDGEKKRKIDRVFGIRGGNRDGIMKEEEDGRTRYKKFVTVIERARMRNSGGKMGELV